MNELVQYILVFTALGLAIWFLLKKYVLPVKAKEGTNCGNDSCGCH